jgi:ribosomal protein S18 acetylase RimI-like enzyme
MSEAIARLEVVDRSVVNLLQWRVLRSGPPPQEFPADPPGAFSVAAFDAADGVIGAATFLPEASPDVALPDQWRLRGMATDPALQGQRIGAAVLERGMAEVAARGGRSIWCNARSSALGFYRRAGFATIGEEFVIADLGIPHVLAARAIPGELVPESAPNARA